MIHILYIYIKHEIQTNILNTNIYIKILIKREV